MRIRDWSSDVCSSDLKGLERSELAHAAGVVKDLVEGVDLFGAKISDQRVGSLLAGTRASRTTGSFDGGDVRQYNPGLAKCLVNADRYRHPLVGRPCLFRGRFDLDVIFCAGLSPNARSHLLLSGMVRHSLFPLFFFSH